jgi:ribonuclease HII
MVDDHDNPDGDYVPTTAECLASCQGLLWKQWQAKFPIEADQVPATLIQNWKQKRFRSAATHPLGLRHNKQVFPWPVVEATDIPHNLYIDEVGMGCFAGPMYIGIVYLGQVALPLPAWFAGHDSKLLSEHERQLQYHLLKDLPGLVYHLEVVSVDRIDAMGLGMAWRWGIQHGVQCLLQQHPTLCITHAILDGNKHVEVHGIKVKPVIAADRTYVGVSIAAILAKQARDDYMVSIAPQYPHFTELFTKGKGYCYAPIHKTLLEQGLATDLHRKSFNPLRTILGHQQVPQHNSQGEQLLAPALH